MQLADLLATQFSLPSIPKVVALLLSELDADEPDLKKINQLVCTDPALTMRLMQIANSGFFQLTGKINGVSECLAVLGLGHLRAMANAAASGTSPRALAGINLQQFWGYSLNVAKVARSLAGVVRQNSQAAYTSGLVHAVGELAMHIGMPDEMSTLNTALSPLNMFRATAERRKLKFNFADVSAGYARNWQFPQPIVDALAYQCAPFDNEVYEPLAGLVHLASWRARAKEARLNEREMVVTFPAQVGEVLELDIDMVLQQDPIDWSDQAPGRQLL